MGENIPNTRAMSRETILHERGTLIKDIRAEKMSSKTAFYLISENGEEELVSILPDDLISDVAEELIQ